METLNPKTIDPFSVPRVGVALLVVDDNKILLHRRLGKHAHGFWACPGGHLEMWESFEETALRELQEECGDIEVTSPELFTAISTTYPDEGRHYATIFLTCGLIAGEPKIMEPDKAEKLEWFSWSNGLPSPLMQGIQKIKDKQMNPVHYHYITQNNRFLNAR